jgi:hypothetical protein
VAVSVAVATLLMGVGSTAQQIHTIPADEVVLIDPKVYTQPITMRAELRREPDMHILEYTCSTSLWEAYLLENDLTPPDLPR